eukprot:CAMPEP_0178422188 /NCGR_PEP_ID=MMETSP0689_2-20121128/27042_1 /TAXON_ID=160604 /ORGANISM="Amphidinium massartii, Strain CS-259" /LENGTH=192 /DNA_ID=CAMNT_0020043739 /DNA_START=75 /DNA_END=649 /DNA_ORIENTATION=+
MPAATIEITDGIQERTSRLALKKAMMVFGEVEACHMGDRAVELPIVRFRQQSAAEAALNALKGGQVFVDGHPLNGEWRGTRTPAMMSARRQRDPPPAISSRRDETEDLSSRMLLQNRTVLKSPPRHGLAARRRSRSRSRRRKRSRSRSPKMLMAPAGAMRVPAPGAKPLEAGAAAATLVLAPMLLFEAMEMA